jgi:hypothetical protein
MEDPATTTAVQETNCLPDTVRLSLHLQPLFNYNCVGTYCHSGNLPPGKVNLENNTAYASLMAGSYVNTSSPAQSKLYLHIMDEVDPMPPEGKMDACKTDLILKWLQQGAPNN